MSQKMSENSSIIFLLDENTSNTQTSSTENNEVDKVETEQFSIELDFRKYVTSEERRTQMRFPYWGKVFIHEKGSQKTISATANDITDKGIGLSVPAGSIEKGKEVTIEFPESDRLQALTIEAKVVSIQKRQGRLVVGFQVTHMSRLTEQKIKKYMDEATTNHEE